MLSDPDTTGLTTRQIRELILQIESEYPDFATIPRSMLERHYQLCLLYWARPDWPLLEYPDDDTRERPGPSKEGTRHTSG